MDRDKDFQRGWRLNPDSIKTIRESNPLQKGDVNPFIDNLIMEAKEFIKTMQSTDNYIRNISLTEFMDFSDEESNAVPTTEIKNLTTGSDVNTSSVQEISGKLVHSIADYYNCIHIIVDILSIKDEKMLSCILKEAWKQISDVEEKKKFIIALMTNDKGALFCRDVLLKWFQHDESDEVFYSMLPVAILLDNVIINEIALPLLNCDESVFVREPTMFKEFLNNLSEEQKITLMRCFLDQLKNISPGHFVLLSLLMDDSTFDEDVIESLLNFLQHYINAYNKNRYIGKILLSIALNLESLFSHDLRTLFSQVAEGYTGVARLTLRGKIRNLLGTQ